MITVTNTAGYIKATGHAGAGDFGHDLVCEAFGCLAQTLLYSIENLTEDTPQSEIDRGYFYLSKKGMSEKSRLLTDSFILGVQMLTTAYPENIKLVQA